MAGLTKISTKKRIRGESGFTLIELLIVVAIIAIIAAIAVPNIISTNIRAKVKGVRADMGSIAIALEDYRIDHGYYPPQYEGNYDKIAKVGTSLTKETARGLGKLIYPTTSDNSPVYLTSIPEDPFNPNSDPGGYYSYFTTGDPTAPTAWALVSYGPDRVRSINSYDDANDPSKIYDQNAGIISSGDIVLTGP